jgi:replicative superfamily II helicase
MSFSVTSNVKKTKYTKNNKNTNEKGFWEYSRFQKNENDINEQYIKSKCPTGNFDHNKIHNMMYPQKNRNELLMEKYLSGQKLKSDEKIIVQNILDKNKKDIENDHKKIDRLGLNASDISTDEGRIRKLLIVAKQKLDEEDYDMLYYVSQKLYEFDIPEHMYEKYNDLFNDIDDICNDIDKIKLQFTKFHSNMPPLNQKGFKQLDPFQKEVIYNIDNNISTIVQAPTSSGKSILTGYLYTKPNMKAIVVVPTDILAWQMASMIGRITKKDIPIVTETYQSSPKRDILLEKIHNSGIVVGTPTYLLDFLPLINVDFNWLVIDEIHMIGHKDCYEMETIAKVYSKLNILALSATIGNVDELRSWFETIGFDNIQVVKCEKRFFNLQQYYYNNRNIHRIHPLSMVTIDSFENKSILSKNINITPPDVWDLIMKLKKYDSLVNTLKPQCYFDSDHRVTLDECNEYFKDILEYMVNIVNIDIVKQILDDYSNIKISDKKEKLINLAFTLKRENKCPAIIFHTNTFKCLELVKQFSKDVKFLENRKYPDLYKERLKQQSRAKSLEKKRDKMKLDDLGEKKLQKVMMKGDLDIFEGNVDISLNEPHKDFIFNKHQKITQHQINQWNKELSNFFPMDGSEYHYIIDLLWRGVGVYVKGLPDPYLRIVQNMACDGELAIVFSDESLVFGVSMPFRTTVITKDNIDSMMYHQMAGRAGRRGLDKEGNVVFINNNWEEIKELSVSKIPDIIGNSKHHYANITSIRLSNNDKWKDAVNNYINQTIDISIVNKYNTDIIYEKMHFLNTDDNDMNHMIWKLRHNKDCFRIPFLITYMRKLFRNCEPTSEKTQIEFAQFMLRYVFIKTSDNNTLDELESAKSFEINNYLNKLEIGVPENIDSKMFLCIRSNKLLQQDYELREDLIKFSDVIKHVQHYFYHKKEINITRLIGKLLTRLWWIYHTSSPIMN